jgi:Holliday junction resolvase
MTRYAVGRRFEWRVRRYYEKLGYFVVRSAGSKGPVDLVALGGYRPLIIQCKVRNPRKQVALLEKEATKLRTLANSIGAKAVWAIRKGRKMILQEL